MLWPHCTDMTGQLRSQDCKRASLAPTVNIKTYLFNYLAAACECNYTVVVINRLMSHVWRAEVPRHKSLWLPCVADADIIFLPCGFFLLSFYLFSERELTFTFAICYRPSVYRLSSVCRLSVCNVRAPYSGGSNFRQYFYGIWYPSHPLTSTENFTEIVPGEPLRRGS